MRWREGYTADLHRRVRDSFAEAEMLDAWPQKLGAIRLVVVPNLGRIGHAGAKGATKVWFVTVRCFGKGRA